MALLYQKKLLLTLFFLSGFSALVYEVIWARLLALSFGSTFEAVSAVVTAFMAGLAIGSYFMGKLADRHHNILLLYSLTELGIGVSGISLYFILISMPDIHSSFHHIWGMNTDISLFHGRQYLFEFFLVFVPASFIGATFPLMVKSYISSRNHVGEGMSLIYTANTLGAVLGAFLAGFFLLPNIGLRFSIFTAASINLLLSVVSYLAGRFYLRPVSTLQTFANPKTGLNLPFATYNTPRVLFSIITILFLSGFSSLAYQMAWTRVLVMVIGNSVYAFTTILTTFLLGISIGSLAFIQQIEKVKNKILLLGILQLLLCFSVIGMLPMMDSLPAIFLSLFKYLPTNFTDTILIEFMLAFAVMLLPTILMGASFPVAARIYISTVDNVGEGLGRLYAANTVGAIFGSLFAGFIFIPDLGIQKTILILSTLNLASFIILATQSEIEKGWRFAIAALSVFVFLYYAATIHAWNKNLLNRGVYLYADVLKKLPDMGVTLTKFSDEFKLLYYKEGRQGTVAVSSAKGILSLQINGKTDAGTSDGDMTTQIMSAAIPHLVHKKPSDTLIIGLGSGVTLGAIERFPVQKIDSIEILTEVIEANKYFSSFNHDALSDPRVNMMIADGRQYLSTTTRKYDVIISEPSNPWITGVSNLFTQEFFKTAKMKLKSGGILCQWYQLYSLDTKELKVLLNTFSSVFPYVSIYSFTTEDLIVLGSESPIALDDDRLAEAFSTPEIRQELMRIGINTPDDIKSAELMGISEIKTFCRGAGLNTDDRPIIEFEAPKALYKPTADMNIKALISAAKHKAQL